MVAGAAGAAVAGKEKSPRGSGLKMERGDMVDEEHGPAGARCVHQVLRPAACCVRLWTYRSDFTRPIPFIKDSAARAETVTAQWMHFTAAWLSSAFRVATPSHRPAHAARPIAHG